MKCLHSEGFLEIQSQGEALIIIADSKKILEGVHFGCYLLLHSDYWRSPKFHRRKEKFCIIGPRRGGAGRCGLTVRCWEGPRGYEGDALLSFTL